MLRGVSALEDCEDIDEDEDDGDKVVADDIMDDVLDIDAGVNVDGEYADEGIGVEIFSF